MILQIDLAAWLARFGQWTLSVDGVAAPIGAPVELPDGTDTVVLELRVRSDGGARRAVARVEVDVAGKPTVNVLLPALRARGEILGPIRKAAGRSSTRTRA